MIFSDPKINFGTFIVKSKSKTGQPIGEHVVEAATVNPDGSGWLILQIDNDWLIEGDTIETDLRGQFGKVAVEKRFSFTVQGNYRTQVIGFGGIDPMKFLEVCDLHQRRIAKMSGL